MPQDGFEAKVTSTEKGSVVELSGVVNRAAKDGMEEAYRRASETPGEILLDFASVEYINSTGIAVIVGILAMARAENRKVGAVGLTDHYREVFQITRLSDFMHIYEDASSGT
jgi:anti-anti-sigma factor